MLILDPAVARAFSSLKAKSESSFSALYAFFSLGRSDSPSKSMGASNINFRDLTGTVICFNLWIKYKRCCDGLLKIPSFRVNCGTAFTIAPFHPPSRPPQPLWHHRHHPRPSSRQHPTLIQRFQPDQCQRPIPPAGADFAGFAAIFARHQRPRLRQRALDRHRHQALLYQPAIFLPRGQFLADIAALVPGDAVQLIEAVFQQDGFFRHNIPAAIGDSVGEAQRSPTGPFARLQAPRAEDLGAGADWRDQADAEGGESGIDETDAASDRRGTPRRVETQCPSGALAPAQPDFEPGRDILDR